MLSNERALVVEKKEIYNNLWKYWMQLSLLADQTKSRASTEPTLSPKVIAKEVMAFAEQEFSDSTCMCICM
jgi:hypothetical protein